MTSLVFGYLPKRCRFVKRWDTNNYSSAPPLAPRPQINMRVIAAARPCLRVDRATSSHRFCAIVTSYFRSRPSMPASRTRLSARSPPPPRRHRDESVRLRPAKLARDASRKTEQLSVPIIRTGAKTTILNFAPGRVPTHVLTRARSLGAFLPAVSLQFCANKAREDDIKSS